MLPWVVLAVAVAVAAFALFSRWAVNAETFGKHDLGLSLFFSFASAWAAIACVGLVPLALVAAVAARVARAPWPSAYLLAAALGAVPLLI